MYGAPHVVPRPRCGRSPAGVELGEGCAAIVAVYVRYGCKEVVFGPGRRSRVPEVEIVLLPWLHGNDETHEGTRG